jgi:hypothetical protein
VVTGACSTMCIILFVCSKVYKSMPMYKIRGSHSSADEDACNLLHDANW